MDLSSFYAALSHWGALVSRHRAPLPRRRPFRVVTATRLPITQRSRAFACATSRPSVVFSAGCWRSVPRQSSCRLGWWRSTAPRSPRRPPSARRAAISRSLRRSSRTPPASTRPRTSSTVRRAATSCPRVCAPAAIRRQRLREAKQGLEAERAAKATSIPRDRDRRLAECKRRLQEDWELERRVIAEHEAWRARGIASDGSRRMSGGHLLKPHPMPSQPAGKINVTTPTHATSRRRAAGCRATTPRPWSLPSRS
jgi:hypothetical protein